MHVLVVSNLFPPDVLGGYELLAHDVVLRLRARGHRVTVLTASGGLGPSSAAVDPAVDAANGVFRTMRLARPFGEEPGRDRARHALVAPWNRRAVRDVCEQAGRPDAALVMSLRRVGPEPLRALHDLGIPFVVTVNDDWPATHAEAPKGASLRKVAASLVDRAPFARHTFRGVPIRHVVYLSAAIRDHVLASGAPFPIGTVLPQGVDTELFQPPVDPAERVKGELLFVGRLHPSKAPDVAIEALAELRAQGRDVRLTLAGAPVTEQFGRDLAALAKARGVEAHVTFAGLVPRDELPRLYRRAEAFIFLGRYAGEAQGLVPLEAMACGTPVVFSALGGAKEFFTGHGATLDAAACDGPSVAAAFARLDDPAVRASVVERGLQLVRTRGSLDAYADALIASLGEARQAAAA